MYRYKLKEIEVGDTETQKGQKTTVTNIDPKTGGITWSVEDVAAFDTAYKSFDKIRRFLKKLSVAGESKDDTTIDSISDQMNSLFNEFRTHLRKNYPDQYKQVLRLKEGDEEGEKDVQTIEKLLKKINNKKEWGELINKLVSHEVPSLTGMGKKAHLLAITKQLKESTKSQWDAIDVSRTAEKELSNKEWNERTAKKLAILKSLNDAGKFKKNWDEEKLQGWVDKNYSWEKVSLQSVKEEEVDEGEGISYLTPDAFDKNKKSTGASDIYYYKLGYKPVPKEIEGAGTIVKQLWEKEEINEYSDFQQKRINVFDELEEKFNQVSPLLSNAKSETAKFYNENPGSYAIAYSTDMIDSYVDNIIELLKQSEE